MYETKSPLRKSPAKYETMPFCSFFAGNKRALLMIPCYEWLSLKCIIHYVTLTNFRMSQQPMTKAIRHQPGGCVATQKADRHNSFTLLKKATLWINTGHIALWPVMWDSKNQPIKLCNFNSITYIDFRLNIHCIKSFLQIFFHVKCKKKMNFTIFYKVFWIFFKYGQKP